MAFPMGCQDCHKAIAATHTEVKVQLDFERLEKMNLLRHISHETWLVAGCYTLQGLSS